MPIPSDRTRRNEAAASAIDEHQLARDGSDADEVRGLLDGHVVLDRAIAARGRYPAVDVLASASRVMDAVVDEGHRAAAQRVRALLGAYEQRRDLIALGAYRAGTEPTTDAAVARMDALEGFLRQGRGEVAAWEDTVAAVRSLGE